MWPLSTSFFNTPAVIRFLPPRPWCGPGNCKASSEGRTICDQAARVTHIAINVKQSKVDTRRLGANLTLGRTGDDTCPVQSMCGAWFQASNVQPDEPLFKGMTYSTMLPTLRNLTKPEREPRLCGLHSFRVGTNKAQSTTSRIK